MEINFDTLPFIVGLAIVFLSIYILLYYKFIYSVIDPLFIWVLTTAFASVLAVQVIPDIQGIFHFLGCQLTFWIGFLLAYKRGFSLDKEVVQTKRIYTFSDQSLLRWTTYSLFIVYVLSNIIIGYSKGFAFLSDTPTESKIANFTEGFGLFRKINWSTGTFVTTSLIYMYLLERSKKDIVFLLIVIFFYSLDGSKASLLQIVISAGIVFYHPMFSDKKILLKKFKRYLPVVFVLIMSTFFVVLSKENDGIDNVFFAFIRRLLYSADSLLYYNQPINIAYFEKYSSWDYISVITNPILGFLRLQPYKESIGVVMVDNLRPLGSSSSPFAAPTAPFYIEARIYFSFWIGFPFSMLIGYLYARARVYYFNLKRSSAFYFIFIGSFIHLFSSILGDVNLAVTQSFDLVFFVIPPYLVISLLLAKKVKIKLSKNLLRLYKSL